MRYTLRISYNGSDFYGWQRQPGTRTVQGEIERALSIFLGNEIPVTGAGRTDTGVNAVNYIAHFDLPDGCSLNDAKNFLYKINAILPKGITVHEVREAGPDFHARFSALSREYHYFIHRKKDPFMENFSWYCRYPLDLEKMNAAARNLLGRHDFSCFEKKGGNNLTSICTISEAVWETWLPPHVSVLGYPCGREDFLMFRIRADRFLRNMVRAIVGTLVEVGRGRRSPEWTAGLLRDGDRSAAGESVPGNALFLSRIEYADENGGL